MARRDQIIHIRREGVVGTLLIAPDGSNPVEEVWMPREMKLSNYKTEIAHRYGDHVEVLWMEDTANWSPGLKKIIFMAWTKH